MNLFVFYLLLFIVIGIGFIFVHLLAGKLFRPIRPDPEKQTIYECGEPTIGSAWVQFDVRYYVIALLFVIFDVEVAFFFPWAVVFGHTSTLANEHLDPHSPQVLQAQREILGSETAAITPATREAARQFTWLALIDIGVFFGVLLVGFAYLWKRGDLNWVRSVAAEEPETVRAQSRQPVLVGADDNW
jgi:NADH-quinone oxidoreductase subunit A